MEVHRTLALAAQIFSGGGFHHRIGADDVEMVLGIWGQSQAKVNSTVGISKRFVHCMVTREDTMRGVDAEANFPENSESGVDGEERLQDRSGGISGGRSRLQVDDHAVFHCCYQGSIRDATEGVMKALLVGT